MTVRNILKMGDPRLLRVAQPVTAFDADDLHLLITDLLDTMIAATAILAGAELATVDPEDFKVFLAHGLKLHPL